MYKTQKNTSTTQRSARYVSGMYLTFFAQEAGINNGICMLRSDLGARIQACAPMANLTGRNVHPEQREGATQGHFSDRVSFTIAEILQLLQEEFTS